MDDRFVRVLVSIYFGSLLSAGMGHMTYPEVPAFVVDARFDLATVGLLPADGSVESALPDWSGRIWFVTEAGAVGFVDPRSGAGSIVRLAGESIGNSFAVDETGGVFVVSDHAIYRFDVDARGAPTVTFREAYDRGTRKKPGQVNFGSGTTPTLLDGDLVASLRPFDPQGQRTVSDDDDESEVLDDV